MPPLAITELLFQGDPIRPDSTRLSIQKRGINLDEGLRFGDPWAIHPQKTANNAHLPGSTGTGQLPDSVTRSSYREAFSPQCLQDPSPFSSSRASSNKRRRSLPQEEKPRNEGTASPPTVLTPSSSIADSLFGDDDRGVWFEGRSLKKLRTAFREETHRNDQFFPAPRLSESHIGVTDLSVENGERNLCTMDGTGRHGSTQHDLAEMKRKVHANNEHVRRREETKKIYKIDGLLPPELLIDVRMGNLKEGHTKLQILGACVDFLEALSEDTKQRAMGQCRENLEKPALFRECYCQVGTGTWNANTSIDGLSSMMTQTPPPSNYPSPRDSRFQ